MAGVSLSDSIGNPLSNCKFFLTGSRAYGKAREDSDIDLVMLVDEAGFKLLQKLSKSSMQAGFKSDSLFNREEYELDQGKSDCLRFGSLNLIVHTNENVYNGWKKATEKMVKLSNRGKPVDRKTAVSLIKLEVQMEVMNCE